MDENRGYVPLIEVDADVLPIAPGGDAAEAGATVADVGRTGEAGDGTIGEIANRVTLFRTRAQSVSEVVEAEQLGVRIPDDANTPDVRADAETDVHTVPLDQLLLRLNSMPGGLTSIAAARRLKTDGPNALRLPKKNPALEVLRYLFSGFGGFIWTAALLVFLSWKPIGDPPTTANLALAIVLVLVALLSAGFTAFQEYQSSKIMQSLQAMIPSSATVLRDGQEVVLPSTQLVIGDVVIISAGSRIPADVRFMSISNLRIDTSNLTGESEPVSAALRVTDNNFMLSHNLAFYGSSAVEGSGRAVVVATANDMVMGKIALLALGAPQVSPLQLEIRRFIFIIAALGSVALVAVLVAWGVWLRQSYPNFLLPANVITTCVGIGIAFLPEGLPVSVALTLTAMARRMYKNHVLVRNLGSVETLGSVNLIASDKTGTLTQNKMSVSSAVLCTGELVSARSELHHRFQAHHRAFSELLGALSLCSRAVLAPDPAVEQRGDADGNAAVLAAAASTKAPSTGAPSAAGGPGAFFGCPADRTITGDASDCAIMTFCMDFVSVPAVRQHFPKLAEIPFNSRNKWMLTVHQFPARPDAMADTLMDLAYAGGQVGDSADAGSALGSDSAAAGTPAHPAAADQAGDASVVLYIKGAAELMLKRCTRMLLENGVDEAAATGEQWKRIQDAVDQLSRQGQRVLAICRTSLTSTSMLGPDMDPDSLPLNDLCYLGMVGLADPPRPEVPGVVQRCLHAGIKVIMVTGDHPNTAVAIARKVGIIRARNVDTVQDFHADAFVPPSYEDLTKISLGDFDPARVRTASIRRGDPQTAPLLGGDTDGGQAGGTSHTQRRESTVSMHTISTISQPGAMPARDAVVVAGSDIPALTDLQWDWVFAHRDLVFARTTPEQKLRIVKEAQKRLYTVAVTGDGVNDSPALRQADIGVCMGSGSEIAREAADIVLLDDNFSSILVGVENGRLLFENLRKVILYLLPAGTWSELLPVLANVFLGLPLPLSSFLMIYICVATDMAPSLAMIKEHAEADLMQRKPRDRRKIRLVSWRMLIDAYAFKGMIESLTAFGFYFWYMYRYANLPMSSLFFDFSNASSETLYTAQSVYFLTLVEMQFGNLLATRTRRRSFFQQNPLRGPTVNHSLFVAIPVSLGLTLIILLVPFLQNIFDTRPPPIELWFAPLIFSVVLFACDELRKYCARRWPKGMIARIAW